MSNDARWYVVHTYSGYENKVATNVLKAAENRKMQDEIFEVKIPTEMLSEDSAVEFLHDADGSVSLLIKNVIL